MDRVKQPRKNCFKDHLKVCGGVSVYSYVWLTEGPCEPLRLVIVDYGHTQSIEAHQTQNDPVEALSFHHAANEEPGPLLLTPEVGGAVQFTAAFHTGPTKRRSRRSWKQWWRKVREWMHECAVVKYLSLFHSFHSKSLWFSCFLPATVMSSIPRSFPTHQDYNYNVGYIMLVKICILHNIMVTFLAPN